MILSYSKEDRRRIRLRLRLQPEKMESSTSASRQNATALRHSYPAPTLRGLTPVFADVRRYDPKQGLVAPMYTYTSSCAAGDCFSSPSINGDTTTGLFCWDGSFASYMLGMDALDLSFSNLIQIVKMRTAAGEWVGVGHARAQQQFTRRSTSWCCCAALLSWVLSVIRAAVARNVWWRRLHPIAVVGHVQDARPVQPPGHGFDLAQDCEALGGGPYAVGGRDLFRGFVLH